MGRVRISLSMSLDGYIAGSGVTPETPLGHGGDVIRPGGELPMVEQMFAESGAAIAGRGLYDLVDGWGPEPPYKTPVFVPTHRPRPDRVAGTTTFTFVPDVKIALDLAREAAGEAGAHSTHLRYDVRKGETA